MKISEAPLKDVPEIVLFSDGLKDETHAFLLWEH